MCIVSVCMSVFVLPVCPDPRQLEDGIRCPGTGVLSSCWLAHVGVGMKSLSSATTASALAH